MALNVCMMTFLRLTTQSLRYRHDLGVVGLDYTLDSQDLRLMYNLQNLGQNALVPQYALNKIVLGWWHL